MKNTMNKNGIDHVLGGDYYIPDLILPQETHLIGKYGRMHREYLKEHNPMRYDDLVLICGNEEKPKATMTDEQKELFSRYTDAVREYQTMAACLLFQNSFKLGARIMVEVMEE